MNIWYTNADALTNKVLELEERIWTSPEAERPHIIAITEIKPKNYELCFSEVDFTIKGYTPHLCNHDNRAGKGIVLYVANNLVIMDSTIDGTFEEAISVKLRLYHFPLGAVCVPDYYRKEMFY